MDAIPTIAATDVLARLMLAGLLGGLIGLERERLERAAGLRTHALVAVASALIMLVSSYGFSETLTPNRFAVLDPSRVAAQVVSGVGFIGAGVIIFRRNAIRGLTTAASVWSVAGVGLAVGGGLYFAATAATMVMLIIQAGLRPIERRYFVPRQEHQIVLRVPRDRESLAAIERVIERGGADLRRLQLRELSGVAEDQIRLELGVPGRESGFGLVAALRAIDGVRLVSYDRGVSTAAEDENVDA